MINIGDHFGNLTVIRKCDSVCIGNRKYSSWLCVCQCGNTKQVPSCYLRNGHTQSCGCNRLSDIIGQRFGRLVVRKLFRRAQQPSGLVRTEWLCDCDCGYYAIVAIGNLKSGHTTSCGCLRNSAQESLITHILQKQNIRYQKQYMFEDCLSPKGNKLRFDFALFNGETLIALLQYQGSQHFVTTKNFEQYGKQQRQITDGIKKQYCAQHSIPLYQITYEQDTATELAKILHELYDDTVPSSQEKV